VHDDGFCRLTAHGASAQYGLVPNAWPGSDAAYGFVATAGLCDARELVVFAPRGSFDVLLRRFGPQTGTLPRMQAHLAAWDDAGRPGNAELRVTVDPAGTTRASFTARARR
jgi:hypothetical protein